MMTALEYFDKYDARIYEAVINPPVKAAFKDGKWNITDGKQTWQLSDEEFDLHYEEGMFVSSLFDSFIGFRRKLSNEEIAANKVYVIGITEKVALDIGGVAHIVQKDSALVCTQNKTISVYSGEEERLYLQPIPLDETGIDDELPAAPQRGGVPEQPERKKGKVIPGRFPKRET